MGMGPLIPLINCEQILFLVLCFPTLTRFRETLRICSGFGVSDRVDGQTRQARALARRPLLLLTFHHLEDLYSIAVSTAPLVVFRRFPDVRLYAPRQ